MRSLAILILTSSLVSPAARAATLTIVADRDTTLFEHADGLLANGSGPDLFVGRNNQPIGSVRRVLVHFDLSDLPKHAVIESAKLVFQVGPGNPGPRDIVVHRVTADWGEGASFGTGGGGEPSAPGDATWRHRFFDPALPAPPAGAKSDTNFWRQPGGDFEPVSSAVTKVGGPGSVVFEGPDLTTDVQSFVDRPKQNFGWILIGDESAPQTAKRLQSRQGLMLALVPRLEVTYRAKK